MKRLLIIIICALACSFRVSAAPLVIENFDGTPVGTKWKMWDRWGNPISSTAEVIADPKNSSNHVLKVTVNGWNCFPEFPVPSEYKGAKILERFKTIRFRFYRPTSDQNDYKQMHVFFGSDVQYDDNGGYPYQGDRNIWQNRSYNIVNVPATSTATTLHLGIHCDVSEYYIDDVSLYGEYDDYVTYESQTLDLSGQNTSTTYKTYTTPTYIPKDTKLDFYTARYADIYAPFAGEGTLNIYSGGERTYLGEHSGKKYEDWSRFTGDVHVYPYKKLGSGNGFYGLVMGTNGKTFSPENIDDGINSGKACNALANNRVFLHDGATIAFENGTRGAIFGELNTEAGSRIQGYYKSSTNGSYVIVGGLNTDATMAGTIAPYGSDAIGIIKDGTGIYTLTANNNKITGGIRVRNGRVNICNDASAAEKSKLSGGTGTPSGTMPVAYVFGNGVLGGTGNIAGIVDVYGTVEPGTEAPGTLKVKNFVSNTKATLVMHPNASLRFKVKSATEYDQLLVNNAVEYSTATELIGVTSDAKPRIKVVLMDDDVIKVGDKFAVLTTPQKLDIANNWKVSFPKSYTWKAEEEQNTDGTYSLVLSVTSLKDDPDNADDGENEGEDVIGKEEIVPESFGPDGDTKSLRQYAEEKGLRIGAAIASYRVPLDNSSDARTAIAKKEFNMVVNENELKWESCEPSQNNFTYGGGDGLLYFASNNKQYMRGHTLVWHSQVAEWVSVDGKKNDKGWTKQQLMDILKNHITNVVTHYKGRIGEWDVVNECLDDDQSIVRTNPNGYKLRASSIWTTVCGEAFIDSAFVWAHRADPNAKLYLNDYDNETLGTAKAQAFYNLAKRLKQSGRPIDGVGFQCHLDAGHVDAPAIGKNIERFAPLGLECAVTELDLGIKSTSTEDQQLQARDYYRVVKTAMEQSHCRSVLIWGLTDDLSWRSSNPLPWNGSVQKKPAYYGVRQALKDAKVVNQLLGDVNTDGKVDVEDANMLVNYVLGLNPEGFEKAVADVDGDGKISVSDANAIVNVYLKK